MKTKQLYLIRHAKSSWSDATLEDFDRPLNKRGREDAPFMGNIIIDKEIIPDLILSSSALRAKTTAKILSEVMEYKHKIIYKKELYLTSVEELLSVIQNQREEDRIIFLVGHNPELTKFANFLSGEDIENIPTCGIVHLKTKSQWEDLGEKSCQLVDFLYPKKYR